MASFNDDFFFFLGVSLTFPLCLVGCELSRGLPDNFSSNKTFLIFIFFFLVVITLFFADNSRSCSKFTDKNLSGRFFLDMFAESFPGTTSELVDSSGITILERGVDFCASPSNGNDDSRSAVVEAGPDFDSLLVFVALLLINCRRYLFFKSKLMQFKYIK